MNDFSTPLSLGDFIPSASDAGTQYGDTLPTNSATGQPGAGTDNSFLNTASVLGSSLLTSAYNYTAAKIAVATDKVLQQGGLATQTNVVAVQGTPPKAAHSNALMWVILGVGVFFLMEEKVI